MAKDNVPVSSKSSGTEIEVILPGDKAKKEPPETRLSEFSISTKHLPESKSWTPGERYTITLDVLFRGLSKSYRDDGEQDAEMLILPKKATKDKEKSKT